MYQLHIFKMIKKTTFTANTNYITDFGNAEINAVKKIFIQTRGIYIYPTYFLRNH